MPPAAAIVAVAAATALGGVVAGLTTTMIVATTLISAGLAAAQTFLFQPDQPDVTVPDFPQEQQGRLAQFRQSVTPTNIIYGRARISGPIAFATATSDNKYLHLVIPLAFHEIDSFEAFLLDDYVLYPDDLDADSIVSGGRYDGLIRFNTHLGAADQTADADLQAATGDWQSSARGRGIAYCYVRLEYDRDVFPTGVPKISFVVRGKKLQDDRNSPVTTAWSENAALALNDFLLRANKLGGAGFTTAEIDADHLASAANVCDEFVTVKTNSANHALVSTDTSGDYVEVDGDLLRFQPGDRVELSGGTPPTGLSADTGYYVIVNQFKANSDTGRNLRIQFATSYANALAGTAITLTGAHSGSVTIKKTGEPRYTVNGVISTGNVVVGERIRELLSAMAGSMTHSGGVYYIKAAAWQEPHHSFDENDLRGGITSATKRSRRDRFNAVRGTYASPLHLWQPVGYPSQTNLTFETEDGGERIYGSMDLPFTSRSNTAQRLASIALFRNRNQITVSTTFSMAGAQIRPPNTIYLSNTVRGWSSKGFEVTNWSMRADGDPPAIKVDVDLVSTESADYDFDANALEQYVDPTPDTDLPNPFSVSAPTGLASVAERVNTESGTDAVYNIIVSWDAATDVYVTQDGKYEVQFRLNGASLWRNSYFVDGSQNSTTLFNVEVGESYDVQIRAVNHIGAKSAWSSITNFSVNNPGGATSTEDWGAITDTVSASEDWSTITGTVSTSEDWGSIA